MAGKMKNVLGRRPRRPRTMTKKKEAVVRKQLRAEGHSLRNQDVIIGGMKRALRGTSPPYLPGEHSKISKTQKAAGVRRGKRKTR